MKNKENVVKEISLNRIILPIMFIFISVFLEMVNFLYIGFKSGSGAQLVFPAQWLFNIGAILAIAGLIYLVKSPKAMIPIFFLFLSLQIGINALSANIYGIFGDIFSMDYIKLGREAGAAVRWEYIDFGSIAIYFSILAVVIVAVVLLFKFNKRKVHLKRLSALSFSLILVLLVEACGITSYSCQIVAVTNADSETIENNTSYLYESFAFKTEAYKEFGYYGFYLKNLWDMCFGNVKANDDEVEELKTYIEEGKTTFDELDGRLADDNLIVILCESHEWFGYDPINTPNVWNLINGGANACVFDNYHSHNKTNISEGIVMAGNKAQQNDLSTLVKHYGYDYAYTLPKLFKAAHADKTEVKATYFHTWKRSFYDRDDTYLEDGYGFDEYISVDQYSKYNSKFFGDWVCDSDFIEEFKDDFVPDLQGNGKFLSFFATMTTHGTYDYDNPRYSDLYEKYDENYDDFKAWFEDYYAEKYVIPKDEESLLQFRRYKVGMMEFDRTIGKIFDLLKEKNHLDDTTVVMFADHNAYIENLTYKLKNVEKTDFSNTKVHNVPLIIYNSKLTPGTYSNFCNTYDVFPTIAELHGLCYNKNLAQGYNLFSDSIKNSFFASNLGGMFTDKFYSKNISDVVSLKENFTADDLAQFKSQAERFYQRQKKLEAIYVKNLAI